MSRLLFFFSFTLLLMACIPADQAAEYNPYLDVEMGKLAVAQGQAAIQATNEAQSRKMAEATMQAAREEQRTEQEIRRIEAEIKGTQSALAAEQTLAASTAVVAQATQQAVFQATAFAITQTPMAATQAAIVAETKVNEARAERARVSAWLIPIALTVAILWVAWKIGQYIDERIEIMRRRNSLMETRAGPAVWDWDAYQFILLQDIALKRRLASGFSNFPQAEAVQLSPSKITATGPMDNGDPHKLMIDLVQDAIRIAGEKSNVIPSHGKLNWSGSRWHRAVSLLKNLGAVKTVDQVGTWVQYDSLADLHYALTTGQLSPAPN